MRVEPNSIPKKAPPDRISSAALPCCWFIGILLGTCRPCLSLALPWRS
jgi:hypothetical protein